MAGIDEFIDTAFEEAGKDVVAAVKAHPQYTDLVTQLAERAVQALVATLGG
jgi:hypothetical protein